jgi:hypothetical protein
MDFRQLGDDDKEIVAALHHLILAHWVVAAASAWTAFQAYGRGAVLVDFRGDEVPPDQLPLTGYIRPQDIKTGDDNLEPLRNLMESYNPEREVLFVIYTPLGDTVIELIAAFEGRLTPPEAAAQAGAGLN